MNRLAEEAAYFGAVEDGARSRDDEIERLQKQIMILREALGQLSLYVAHNGDDWVKIQALKALAATADQLEAISDMDARPERSGRSMNNPYGRDGLMAIAAVRYCLGCMSYIVGDCVDWLAEAWPELQESTRKTIQRDIEEAFKMDDEWREAGNKTGRLGMDMDRAEWGRARRLWVTSFITMKR